MEATAPTVLENNFWEYLDRLVAASPLVIDRPGGSHHPHYPHIVYPLDYGYLEGTTTVDGGGLDVWAGTLPEKALTALVLTVDLHKRDVEVKLLLGCTEIEQQAILDFHNDGLMCAVKVERYYKIP
jgi:inorganic pyrophosphatase